MYHWRTLPPPAKLAPFACPIITCDIAISDRMLQQRHPLEVNAAERPRILANTQPRKLMKSVERMRGVAIVGDAQQNFPAVCGLFSLFALGRP